MPVHDVQAGFLSPHASDVQPVAMLKVLLLCLCSHDVQALTIQIGNGCLCLNCYCAKGHVAMPAST